VRITLVDLSSWPAVVVVFLVCLRQVVVALVRSDGPLARALARALTGWVRCRRVRRYRLGHGTAPTTWHAEATPDPVADLVPIAALVSPPPVPRGPATCQLENPETR